MNLFQGMILVSLVAIILIGLFVYIAQPHRRVNQAFLFLSCSFGAWLSTMWGAAGAEGVAALDFWIRQTSAVSALIPPSMNLLRLAIVQPEMPFRTLLVRNIRWFGCWALVALVCQTPPFLESVTPPPPGELLARPNYGWGFPVFSGYFICSWVLLFHRMLKNKKRAKGFKQSDIEYVLLSCAASLFFGVALLIVPNLTGFIDLGAALPLSGIVFTAITAYGIATRGILDVPVLARRIVSMTLLVLFLVLLYLFALHGVRFLLEHLGLPPRPLAPLIATLVVVFTMSPIQGALQQFANRLFKGNPPLDEGRVLREAGRALYTIQTTRELYIKFSNLLEDTLDAESVWIFLREDGGFTRVYPFEPHPGFPGDHPLPVLLGNDHGPVVPELMERARTTAAQTSLRRELAEQKVAAAVGLYPRDRLEGFLLLGPRVSGRIYGQIEGNVLEGLRDLFSVAHENARLYEKIRRTERLASLGTLSAGMAHEIKNPLVTLKTFTQLLPERYGDPEFRDSFTRLAGREIDRIDRLVNQLLHFARPVKPDFRPMSVTALLEEQMEGFQEQAGRDGIAVVRDCTASRDRILGDRHLLQQVFLNLFLNARDAMEGGGALTLRVFDGEEALVVEVSDTGGGIESAQLEHIFDPFYTTKNQGTGLGLAVAHRILEEHLIRVQVRSTPGEGTTFRLEFPLLPKDPPS